MAKRTVEEGALHDLADRIRSGSGRYVPLVFPHDFMSGVDGVWQAGYDAALADAGGTNLFDWDAARFYAHNAYSAKPTLFPTYTDGVWYSGGVYGDTMGYYTCFPVEAGDIITFSADLNVTGTKLNIGIVAGANPVDGVFTSYTKLVDKLENTPILGKRVFAAQIPEGYEWFGFSFVSDAKKQAELRSICITRQNNALGEQAVAYNILMGVTE